MEASQKRRYWSSCVLKGREALLWAEQENEREPALCSRCWSKWAARRQGLQTEETEAVAGRVRGSKRGFHCFLAVQGRETQTRT